MPIFLEREDRTFSHGSLSSAFDVIQCHYNEHAMIENLCLEWGLDSNQLPSGGVTPKNAWLRRAVWDNARHRIQYQSGEEEIELVAVKKAVNLLNKDWVDFREHPERLKRFLSIDGFSIVKDDADQFALQRALPGAFAQPQARNEISTLLDKFGFDTTKGHLNQAINGFTSSNWATSNSQIRTFFESLFDECLTKLNPVNTATGANARTALSLLNPPFLDPSLNEWDNLPNGNKTLVNGLFKRLHPQGNHPGLSHQDDALFRLQITMTTALMFLKRLDARV